MQWQGMHTMFTKQNHLTWLSLAREHSPEESLSLQSWKAKSSARHPETPPYRVS